MSCIVRSFFPFAEYEPQFVNKVLARGMLRAIVQISDFVLECLASFARKIGVVQRGLDRGTNLIPSLFIHYLSGRRRCFPAEIGALQRFKCRPRMHRRNMSWCNDGVPIGPTHNSE